MGKVARDGVRNLAGRKNGREKDGNDVQGGADIQRTDGQK